MARYLISALVACVLAGAVAMIAFAQIDKRSSPSLESFGPSERVLRLVGATFQRATPDHSVIPAAEALKAAGGLRRMSDARDVHSSLVFGRFTDEGLSIIDRPVWTLTTTGFYVAQGHGRGIIRRPAHHEANIVIDAHTGQFLEGFND